MPTRPELCRHTRRQLYRKDFASGTGYHIVELCLDCGRNARGPGVWVARFEAPDPDALPRLPAGGSPGQPGLFDDLPAGDQLGAATDPQRPAGGATTLPQDAAGDALTAPPSSRRRRLY